MAKKGTFQQIPPDKLFAWLADKKQTGTLTVMQGQERKWLFLEQGNIIHAYSKSQGDQIESVLLREKAVTKEALDRHIRQKNGKSVTQALIDQQMLTPTQLDKYKKFQVRDIALSVFDWSAGEFVFQPDVLPKKHFPRQKLPLGKFVDYHRQKSQRMDRPLSSRRMNTAGLPTKNPRKTDTKTSTRRVLQPKPDTVLRIAERPDMKMLIANLTGEEQDVLLLFNGKRPLKDALQRSKIPGKKLIPILAGLLKAHLLEDVNAPVESETASKPKEVTPPKEEISQKTVVSAARKAARSGTIKAPPGLAAAQREYEEGRYYSAHEKVKNYLKKNPGDDTAKGIQKQYANTLLDAIKKTMVSMKSVPKLTKDLNFNDWNSMSLDSRTAFVLTRIDGMANLRQLMSISGFSKGELCMIMYRLLELGIATMDTGTVGAVPDLAEDERERLEKIIDLHKNLGSMTHYQMLGVKSRAGKDEVKNAFVRLSKELHPDSFKGKHFQPYMSKINDVFNRTKEAYDTLKNTAARGNYDVSIGLKEEPKEKTQGRKTNYKANMQYKIAMRCLQRRDYKRATEFLRSALDMAPEEPLYMLRLAEVQLKNARTRDDAKKLVQQAIQIEPTDPFAYRLYASIFEKEGDTKGAVDMYYRSLSFDPGNKEAVERVEALTGKPVDEKYLKAGEGQLIVRKK